MRLRMQRHDLMPKHSESTAPTNAHSHTLRSPLGRPTAERELDELLRTRPNHRFAIFARLGVDPVHLEHWLSPTSKPYVVAFISGPPFLKWLCSQLHFGTSMHTVLEGQSRRFAGQFIPKRRAVSIPCWAQDSPWATTSTSSYAVCCCGSWITSPRSPASPSRRRVRSGSSAAPPPGPRRPRTAAPPGACGSQAPAGWRTRYAERPPGLVAARRGRRRKPSRGTRGVPKEMDRPGPRDDGLRRAPVPTSGRWTAAIRGWQSVRGRPVHQTSAVVGVNGRERARPRRCWPGPPALGVFAHEFLVRRVVDAVVLSPVASLCTHWTSGPSSSRTPHDFCEIVCSSAAFARPDPGNQPVRSRTSA